VPLFFLLKKNIDDFYIQLRDCKKFILNDCRRQTINQISSDIEKKHLDSTISLKKRSMPSPLIYFSLLLTKMILYPARQANV
jgi:hypothetical protein